MRATSMVDAADPASDVLVEERLTHALAEPSRVPRYERLEQALAATIASGALPVQTYSESG